MSYARSLVSLVFGPILLASGCALSAPSDTEGGGEELGEQGAPVSGSPDNQRIILNGLPMSLFSTHRESLINLAGGSLTSHAAAKSQLIQSEEGRQLLGYIMKCALGWGDALSVSHQGSTYLIEGGVGLATNWKDGPLTASEKRWVSACLLAHANAFGNKVPLSLRGDHPALATTAEELEDFPVEEGAFYGDLFATAGSAAPMFACPGLGPKDACEAESNEWLDVRVCAQGAGSVSQCGFYIPGDCYNFEAAAPGACNEIDADGYADCRASMDLNAPAYAEVITVYLRRSAGSACGSEN
jgi:hypothetical protein